jgi:glycosyltransferase involved in cell wall biosynthesis
VPVVATKIAGLPGLVDDGRTGLLVPPGDAVSLGEAMARLVVDPALGRRLADAARATVVPRFGVDRYVASVVALYERLLSQQAA